MRITERFNGFFQYRTSRPSSYLNGIDPKGLTCPLGSHIRRTNPRDALQDQGVVVNLHRILRRGATYGSMLPEGVLEDDGLDRGSIFVFLGSSLSRQFEFVKSQWHNDSDFIGLDHERDVISGANDGSGTFTIPSAGVCTTCHASWSPEEARTALCLGSAHSTGWEICINKREKTCKEANQEDEDAEDAQADQVLLVYS